MQGIRKLSRIIAVLFGFAFFCSVGGQWVVLQSVAWGRMLVRYSRSESLTQAARKTFDGQHPCELCKEIRRAKSTPVRAALPGSLKAKFVEPAPGTLVRVPDFQCPSFRLAAISRAESRPSRPPLPPPRRAA